MMVDFRKAHAAHHPLLINGFCMELIRSTKVPGGHIADDLSWSHNCTTASLPKPILSTFFRGTIESLLTSCINVWYGNCNSTDHKALQRMWSQPGPTLDLSPLHPWHFKTAQTGPPES